MHRPDFDRNLPPEAQFAGARLIDFSDLRNQAEPYAPHEGDVITGMQSAGAIDILEGHVLRWANPGFHPSPQHEVVREPLSRLLKPPKSPTAQLRNGVGVLALDYAHNLFVAADVFSRGRKQGVVGCQVRYVKDIPRHGGSLIGAAESTRLSNVVRTLEHRKVTADLTAALEVVRGDSAKMARGLAAEGLRSVILAGLPTLGRRR